MKRTVIFLLIAASVAVTLYINQQTKQLDPEHKREIEQTLLENTLFPARPVWWSDDKILAIGIVPESLTGDAAAKKACQLLSDNGLTPESGLRVEVYDVLKIQKSDDWTLLGSSQCK